MKTEADWKKQREHEKERDEFLNKVMGECYHDWEIRWAKPSKCFKCGVVAHGSILDYNEHFNNWENFGKLWEWAIEQEWWYECIVNKTDGKFLRVVDCINPDAFADAIYEYLKNKVDKGDK